MTEAITADRGDMLAYMGEARDRGRWNRPSLHHVARETAEAVMDNVETILLFRLVIREGATIEAHRVAGTTDAIHTRQDPEHDQYLHRIAAYGEACMDLRYWLLQAELNNVPLSIKHTHPDAVDLITGTSPPEWRGDIERLLQKYQ